MPRSAVPSLHLSARSLHLSARRGGFHIASWLVLIAVGLGSVACQQSLDQRLEEARALHELGAWEESEAELRGILEQSPDHAEANYLLGVAQLRQGQPSLAIWPLQMAQRDPALAVDASIQLAGAYLQLEQLAVALQAVDQALAADPEDLQQRLLALRIRSQIHMQREEHALAVADTERLVELLPEDPVALALWANALVAAGRPEEATGALRSVWTMDPERTPPTALANAGMGLVRLYADELEDPDAATEQLEAVLERYPADVSVVQFAVAYFEERDDRERTRRILDTALGQAPAELALRSTAAARHAEWGEVEAGARIMQEGAELLDTAAAWLAVERYHRQHGEPAQALAALERTIALVPEPTHGLLFEHGDLLVATGQLDRAEAVAAELADTVYAKILRGSIAFERGQYEQARAYLDAGLRRWPNNVGGRQLAGRTAYLLGDVEGAIANFREAIRATGGASEAALDLSRLHFDRGEYDLAAEFAGHAHRAFSAAGADEALAREGLTLILRARVRQGNVREARALAARLAALEGGRVPANLELAALMAERSGPDAAANALSELELDPTDPVELGALRALCQYLVDADRAEEALSRVEAELEAHPETAALHDVAGRVLFHVGRAHEAGLAFERARALDPELGAPLEGLARLALAAGDGPAARDLLDRAAQVEPADPRHPYAAGQIALAQGDLAGAEQRYREALARDPAHLLASNDLAWVLAERGEALDEALRFARRAAAGSPTANMLDTLGFVQLRRGDAAAAAETLEKAHALDEASPSIAFRLGVALAQAGDQSRARRVLEQALASGGTFPEAEQAREQLSRLEGS